MNLVIKIMINTSIKLAFFLILYHIEICITHGNDDEPNRKNFSIFTTKNHMTMNPIFTNFHYLQPQIIFTFFFFLEGNETNRIITTRKDTEKGTTVRH